VTLISYSCVAAFWSDATENVLLFLAKLDVGIDRFEIEIPVPNSGLNPDSFYFKDGDAGSISPDRTPSNMLTFFHPFFLSSLVASA
jgi:hypothetical protein